MREFYVPTGLAQSFQGLPLSLSHGILTPMSIRHLRGRVLPLTQSPAEALGMISLISDVGPSTDPESCVDCSDLSIAGKQARVGFLDLPGEVRNKVYWYALTALRNRVHGCTRWGPTRGQTYAFGTGIIDANRQIHHEASNMFFIERTVS